MTEYAMVGTEVLRVAATDADSGRNAAIRYRILNEIDDFMLLRKGGGGVSVTLAKPLDREIRDRYQVTVLASDYGTPPLSATTTVHVRYQVYTNNF